MERPVLASLGGREGGFWGGSGWQFLETRGFLTRGFAISEGQINSVQTRCIVKARLRKIHFSGDFLEVFDFLRSAVL